MWLSRVELVANTKTNISGQLFTGTAAAQLDQIAIQDEGIDGFQLMTRAGQSAFVALSDKCDRVGALLVLCGNGNNGGDGYIVAHCALDAGWAVTVLAAKEPNTKNALTARRQYLAAGGRLVDTLSAIEQQFDVLVDAVLGIKLTESARGVYADWLVAANKLPGLKIALDVPSGVDADTGNVFLPAFRADLTVSFIVPKIGLMTGLSRNYVGELLIDDLGISEHIINRVKAAAQLIVAPQFKPRRKDTHKGSFGSTFVVGGDNGMLGATLLAGEAALRSGAGKVTVVSTDQHLDKPALYLPELMSSVYESHSGSLLQQADALAIGPGLGVGAWGTQVFASLIKLNCPLVIDADALTLLANSGAAAHGDDWVLTPHPGEAATLLGVSSAVVQADRVAAVKQIAKQRNCVCVLKGAGTLIAGPKGRVTLCDLGNPGMATAGMGDVLTGMILAFLGQGMQPWAAAETAVYLHAHAADAVVAQSNELSLIAGDVIRQLPQSIRQHS